jgi:hypothetical protein
MVSHKRPASDSAVWWKQDAKLAALFGNEWWRHIVRWIDWFAILGGTLWIIQSIIEWSNRDTQIGLRPRQLLNKRFWDEELRESRFQKGRGGVHTVNTIQPCVENKKSTYLDQSSILWNLREINDSSSKSKDWQINHDRRVESCTHILRYPLIKLLILLRVWITGKKTKIGLLQNPSLGNCRRRQITWIYNRFTPLPPCSCEPQQLTRVICS